MRKLIFAFVILMTIGLFRLSREPKISHQQDTLAEQAAEIPRAIIVDSPDNPKSDVPIQPEPPNAAPSNLSVDDAAERAFATSDFAYQMFEPNELPATRPPPGENEATHFRGLIWGSSPNDERYIEMRFEGGKWIVSVGNRPNEMRAWARRDAIPFRDQADVWTLYLERTEGLFLKHFPAVSIPELNGDYEALSGWLATPATLTHVALIGYNEGWPPEALIKRLFPRQP